MSLKTSILFKIALLSLLIYPGLTYASVGPPTTYTIGGDVSGISGTLVLQNNLADDLSISADGAFQFATALDDAAVYSVTVLTQPSGQTCVVSNGSGTVAAANVTNIVLTCTTNDVTPPARSAGLPSEAQPTGTTQVSMTLTTDEAATCKYGMVASTLFGSIASTFGTTGGTSHSETIASLTNGSTYNYYIRCQDSSANANSDDYTISFSVAAASSSRSGRSVSPIKVSSTGTSSTAVAFTNIKLVVEESTYYVIKDNKRYGVTNPGILFSYGLEFKDGKKSTPEDNAIPYTETLKPGDGALVKKSNDSTVYLIFGSAKQGFASETIFKSLGYSFGNVLEVTDKELDALPLGTPVGETNMAHPSGTFVNQDGTVYRVFEGKKYGIPSMDVYNSFNPDNSFNHVVPANAQDRLLPFGPVLDKRTIQ